MINFKDELVVLLELPKNSSNQDVFAASLVALSTAYIAAKKKKVKKTKEA
jgi:hypothetical protein